MNVTLPIVSFAVGIIGVVLGARLTRRNDKKAVSERLLLEAVNDALAAIARVAKSNGQDDDAMAAYASAMGRIGFHGPPVVVAAFRRFQDDATTETVEGRRRLLDALNVARTELGQAAVSSSDLSVLLFGPGGPGQTRLQNL